MSEKTTYHSDNGTITSKTVVKDTADGGSKSVTEEKHGPYWAITSETKIDKDGNSSTHRK